MATDGAELLKVGGKEVRELRVLGTRVPPTQAALWMGMGPAGAAELVIVQRHLILSEDPEKVVADAQALTRLRHANVARYREVMQNDYELVVVSDYVEGVTLAELRDRAQAAGKPLPLPFVLRVLLDALNGLSAIHALRDKSGKTLRRFHGDLAPDNVVVGIDGTTKIIGLHHAEWENARGTDVLRFMAPELLLLDEDTSDGRADLYAVAAMLWEAIGGKPIFAETSAAAILARHLAGKIEPLAPPADPPWVAQLATVATRGISADPERRHKTALELAAEIRKVVGTSVLATNEIGAVVRELAGTTIAERRAAFMPTPKKAEAPAAPAAAKKEAAPARPTGPSKANAPAPIPAPRATQIGLAPPKGAPPPEPPEPLEAPPAGARQTVDWSDLEDAAPSVRPPAHSPVVAKPPTPPAPPPPAAPPAVPAPVAAAVIAAPAVATPIFSIEDATATAGDRVTSPGEIDPPYVPVVPNAPIAPIAPIAPVVPIADAPRDAISFDAVNEAPPPPVENQRRRRGIVMAVMLLCTMILLIVGVRALTRSGPVEVTEGAGTPSGSATTMAKNHATTATTSVTATATATATTTTTTTATTTTTTAIATTSTATTTAAATNPPTATTSTGATSPTPPPTGTVGTTATAKGTGAPTTTGTGTVHVKPKPTYDPLGI